MKPRPGADTRIVTARNPRTGTPAQVVRAIAIGGVLGLIFGSDPIQRWAEQLPDSPVTAQIQTTAAAWNADMAALGATRPYAHLRAAIRGFESMRF